MRKDIYPVQIMRRRKSTSGDTPTPPVPDDVINSKSVYASMIKGITSMQQSIIMTDAAGKTYKNKSIVIKPSKIHYVDDGQYLTNRSLYCIYEITFPVLQEGDSLTFIVMSTYKYGVDFFVGSNLPAVKGNIDIYEKVTKREWRVEENAGILNYYNYTPNFETKEWTILFPEHIMGSVLYNMLSYDTWRYNYDGIARDIDNIVSTIPAATRPYNITTNVDDLKYIQTFSPAYAAGKIVKIYYDKYLTGMPSPV